MRPSADAAPSLRVISGADVRGLLPMADAISLMADVLAAVSAGRARVPLRTSMPVGVADGRFGLMPGALEDPAVFGIKLLSLFPGNAAAGLSSHLGLMALFEAGHGQPLALIEASSLTAIRTAAVSAVATRLLAREDAGDLALLGAGEQAESHLEALRLVRPIRRVRVWSRTPRHAHEFARLHGAGVEAVDSVVAAVAGADIICTLTGARAPILHGEQVLPGVHINAVGACVPSAAEYLTALAAGAIGPQHISAELGEIVAGVKPGRRDDREITLFKSLGLAAEDLAAAQFILDRARALGVGQTVRL